MTLNDISSNWQLSVALQSSNMTWDKAIHLYLGGFKPAYSKKRVFECIPIDLQWRGHVMACGFYPSYIDDAVKNDPGLERGRIQLWYEAEFAFLTPITSKISGFKLWPKMPSAPLLTMVKGAVKGNRHAPMTSPAHEAANATDWGRIICSFPTDPMPCTRNRFGVLYVPLMPGQGL